jgi:hypothetical protein
LGFAGVAAFGVGLQDPAAITGMGVGMLAFVALFYAAYVAILFAQQAAMVTLASPLERPSFGPALVRGFKSALPFFGIAVLMMLGYLAIMALISVLIVVLGLSGSAGGPIAAAAMLLLFVPVMIYLGCRLAVIIPVVAVDQVYNPFTALRRAWSVTGGKVIGILLVLIGTGLLGILGLGAPMALIFASAIGSDGDPLATIGVGFVVLLLMIPLFILYTVFISAITAVLHSEVTQGGADKLEEVFA